MVKSYKTLVAIIILLIFFSCNKTQKQEKQSNTSKLNNLEYKAPSVIPINKDKIKSFTPGKNGIPYGRVVKAGKPKIKLIPNLPVNPGISYLAQSNEEISTGKKAVLSKIPKNLILNIDSLELFTPGENGLKKPKKYDVVKYGDPHLIDDKYIIQHNDTIYPAITKSFSYPSPTPALSPRYKDNASLNIPYLDLDQGMNSSDVYTMYEDSNGNLWFGTNGGASRYDGKSFTHFALKNEIENRVVISIFEDKQKNMWFGTQGGGVCKYDGHSYTHFTTQHGLSGNFISSIIEDKDGKIWFGTDKGLSVFDGNSFTHYSTDQGLSNNVISTIIQDKSGKIWFGTYNGVNIFNGKSFTHIITEHEFSNNIISSIIEDKNGKIWFGTHGSGLNCFDGKTLKNFALDQGLSNMDVMSVVEGEGGKIWVATYGYGVNCYDGESFTHIGTNEGLNSNLIYSILEDKTGNLWFGTDEGGVSCLYNNSYKHFTSEQGLNGNFVASIYEDKSGKIWFGTWDHGLSRYDENSFSHYTTLQGMSSNYVMAILEDKKGLLWLGTSNQGISSFDGEFFTHYSTEHGLNSNTVRYILEDQSGKLWFGTRGGGVTCFDGNSFFNYSTDEGLIHNEVYSIFEDKSGKIWFGTLGGLTCYDGSSFTNYTTKQGLSNNFVFTIFEDSKGELWFGTENGLNTFDGQSFSTYIASPLALRNTFITSVLEDKNNNLWISTYNKGLAFIKPDKANSTTNTLEINKNNSNEQNSYRFGIKDGLKALSYWTNPTPIDSKNRIWYGSNKGVTMLDLNNYSLPTAKPSIQLNTIELHQKSIDYRQLKEVVLSDNKNVQVDYSLSNKLYKDINFTEVAKYYNYPIELELPYKLNHLTFHFSAIDWQAPHKLKYQYMLDGFDDSWSQASPESKAEYNNIPYGEYTFKLKAIGAAKKWSETFEYSFKIHPPWWHTWWAHFFYIILGLSLIWAYTRWRTAKLKHDRKILKQKVKEHTLAVEEKNEELSQQNEEIHAINNALNEQKKLIEERNIELSNQTETLKLQNEEITLQRDQINTQHKDITDSIEYAKRIQTAVLPREAYIDEILPDNFILNKPRNVVSGDFYVVRQVDHYIIIAVSDCTGHGVPGAIMSMLGISFFNEIVRNKEITQANQVLNELRKQIKRSLHQTGRKGEAEDGMDVALCALDTKTNILQYAGANNPVYVVQNGEFKEIKPDKMPIGFYINETASFSNHEIQLQEGDVFYLFSDGFMDQFGGKNGFKYKASNFQQLLFENHSRPMILQMELLEQELNSWMNGHEQTDDILVMGVRV